jgi:hypothetical protein
MLSDCDNIKYWMQKSRYDNLSSIKPHIKKIFQKCKTMWFFCSDLNVFERVFFLQKCETANFESWLDIFRLENNFFIKM